MPKKRLQLVPNNKVSINNKFHSIFLFISDLLSVPDFSAGAMEDWGLISFRSSLLVFDEKFSTIENKKTGALVIAHELAHQVCT